MVVPFWPNQPWFPLVFKMLTDASVLLTSRKHLLHLPEHPETLHPIWRKMNLLICHLAGSSQKTVGYLKKLHASPKLPGDHQQSKDIRATCTSSQFSHYCLQRNINPAQSNFKIGIEYLTPYFYTGVGYSSVNTARSVLSSILKPENEPRLGKIL